MPCYVTGTREGDLELSLSEARATATKITRLLCSACKELDKILHPHEFPKELLGWWKEHKKIDAKRKRQEREQKEKEQLKKQAKAKLSQKERKALGLD